MYGQLEKKINKCLICTESLSRYQEPNVKCYVVLYIYASTIRVVIDFVPDAYAVTYKKCLKKLFSRRACPAKMLSNNGINYSSNNTKSC